MKLATTIKKKTREHECAPFMHSGLASRVYKNHANFKQVLRVINWDQEVE